MGVETGCVGGGIGSAKGETVEVRKGGILRELGSNTHEGLVQACADLGKEEGTCHQEIAAVGFGLVGLG